MFCSEQTNKQAADTNCFLGDLCWLQVLFGGKNMAQFHGAAAWTPPLWRPVKSIFITSHKR